MTSPQSRSTIPNSSRYNIAAPTLSPGHVTCVVCAQVCVDVAQFMFTRVSDQKYAGMRPSTCRTLPKLVAVILLVLFKVAQEPETTARFSVCDPAC